MDTSQITFRFEELGNFLKNQLRSLVPARNVGFNTITLKISVFAFRIILNFL